jgi:O-antigen/teichoic acid export membrane protein
MRSKAEILLKGSLLRGCEFFIRFAVSLILTPLIIHSLGDKMYGLWVVVGTFIGYYGLMDLGLDLAIARFISRAIGIKDYSESNRVINTALFIFSILGFIILLVSIVIAYIMPYLIKNITETEVFTRVVLILGLNIAIGFPLRVFAGVLTSNIRYDLNTIIEFAKLTVRTTLIIFFLKHGYGLVALAVITASIDIGGYLARYFIVMNIYKYITLSKQYISKAIMKSLFSYSAYVFITRLANQLRFNMDNLVIITFLGLSPITMYSISSRLVMSVIDFVTSTVGVLMPVFSQYEASNRNDLLTEKFLFTTKISSYLSILLGGVLIIFGKVFIERWVGIEYIFSYKILVILLVGIIFNLMQTPSVQLLYGISKHKFLTILNLGEGVINLVLSIVFLKYYGIAGVALGTTMPMVIMSIIVLPVYTCRVIKFDVRKYYLKIILPVMLKSSAILVILWLIFKRFLLPEYITMLITAVPLVFLFSFFVFFWGFNSTERKYFKKIIKGLYKKPVGMPIDL